MIENKPHKMSSMVVGEGTIQVISVTKDSDTTGNVCQPLIKSLLSYLWVAFCGSSLIASPA